MPKPQNKTSAENQAKLDERDSPTLNRYEGYPSFYRQEKKSFELLKGSLGEAEQFAKDYIDCEEKEYCKLPL